MSDEKKNEIIKAHCYGVDEKVIAQANGITVAEVREVLQDEQAIEEKKDFLRKCGWLEDEVHRN